MTWRTWLIAGVLLMSGAFPAEASYRPYFGKYEARVTRGPWAELRTVAQDYWQARGHVTDCRRVRLWVYRDRDPSVSGRAYQPGCDIGLNRRWLRFTRDGQARIIASGALVGTPDNWTGPSPITGDAVGVYFMTLHCANVVHEYGHALGLGHDKDSRSVMYWATGAAQAPAGCVSYARMNWRRFLSITW